MAKIWFSEESEIAGINKFSERTLVSHLGIVITKIGDDFLEATMPVDERTFQPFRMLHGGASCVLAESLGSMAANLCVNPNEKMAVGQHIEATHIRPVMNGSVRGVARPVYLGSNSHTWRIEIFNEENKLICDSKIIMAIKKK